MFVIILRYITSFLLSSAKHGMERTFAIIFMGQLSGNAPVYVVVVI